MSGRCSPNATGSTYQSRQGHQHEANAQQHHRPWTGYRWILPAKRGRAGLLAYSHILGFEGGDSIFKISPVAIDVNDTRGMHVAELTRDALRNMGRYVAGARRAGWRQLP